MSRKKGGKEAVKDEMKQPPKKVTTAPKAAPAADAEADEVSLTAGALIQGAEELLAAQNAEAVPQQDEQPSAAVEPQPVVAAAPPPAAGVEKPEPPPAAPSTELVVQEQPVPNWHALSPHLAEIMGSEPLDASRPFEELEEIALTRFGFSNSMALGAAAVAWKSGEAFHAVLLSFANRRAGDGGQHKYKNWTHWQEAHHLPRSTVCRYINKVYKKYKWPELVGKHLGDLYAGRDDESLPDPMPLGTILRAHRGLEVYVDNKEGTALPVKSCIQIISNDDPTRPTVRILTGDKKGGQAQVPIGKIIDRMEEITEEDVAEPPKPKSAPRKTKGGKGKGSPAPAVDKPKPPPAPTIKITEQGVYALNKEFKVPRKAHASLPKGTYLGNAHKERIEDLAAWTFHVLSGDQAGADYITVTEKEVGPFLDITGAESVARNWLITKKAPPEHMFGAEVTEALQHLHAAAELIASIKLSSLAAGFVAVYKRQIKDHPFK